MIKYILKLRQKEILNIFIIFGIIYFSLGLTFSIVYTILTITNILFKKRKEYFTSGKFLENNKSL